jgi:hypothetical protein
MAAVYRFLDQLLLRHEWRTCCPITTILVPGNTLALSENTRYWLIASPAASATQGWLGTGTIIGLLGLERL